MPSSNPRIEPPNAICIGWSNCHDCFAIMPRRSGEPIREFMKTLAGTVRYLTSPNKGQEVPVDELAGNSRICISYDPFGSKPIVNSGSLFPGAPSYVPNGTVSITIDGIACEPLDKNVLYDDATGQFLNPDRSLYTGNLKSIQGKWGRNLSPLEIQAFVTSIRKTGLENIHDLGGEGTYAFALRRFVETHPTPF